MLHKATWIGCYDTSELERASTRQGEESGLCPNTLVVPVGLQPDAKTHLSAMVL